MTSFISNVMGSTLVVNKIFPATVLITAEDKNGQPQSLGSGFLVAPNIIATNFHVIENSYSGYVKFVNKNEIYEIEGVVGYNESYDLALIKISNSNANPLPLISPSVDIGQKIFAIGNPLGLEGTISDGIISGLREFQDFSVLQISAPISPGNSGGPVVNENGDVVGVATFTMSEGQNINFAVPVKYLKELLENKISQVSLSSLVKIKSASSKSQSSKDFSGISFTKYSHNYNHWCDIIEFSIKNNLRKKIKEIHHMWIIYDSDGEPLDYQAYIHRGTIKSKLAIRTSIGLPRSSLKYLYDKKLLEDKKCSQFWDYVELRILDFQIVEE
ncbi:S1C family serine protease [Alphaproteobacteria bacterium]|nr:S1C family serine protease [Alphaproteobacteria bacterium]